MDLDASEHKAQCTALIVGGFHRSGTSMLMQALSRAGLRLAEDLLPANPSNPDGHFEDRAIVDLHGTMLAAADRYWYTPGGQLSDDINPKYASRAQQIIDGYQTGSAGDRCTAWGFKDPRVCLFIDWWDALLAQPAGVIVFRHYSECFRSLRQRQAQGLVYNPRDGHENLFFWQQTELALQLWLDSNRALLNWLKKRSEDTRQPAPLLVSCQSLLNGYDLIGAVNQRFGWCLDERASSGIRRHQSRNSHPPVTADVNLKRDLDELLAELDALADSSHPEALNDQPGESTTARESSSRRTGLLHALRLDGSTCLLYTSPSPRDS